MSDAPEDYYYFYIAYAFGGGDYGNIILRQNKKKPLEDYPPTLNVASATKYLIQASGRSLVILFWSETTYERYRQWQDFIKNIQTPQPPEGPKGLKLIKG